VHFKKSYKKILACAERQLSHPRARAPVETLFRGNSPDYRGSANPAGQKAQRPNDAPLFPRIREPSGAGIFPRYHAPAGKRPSGSPAAGFRGSMNPWIRGSINPWINESPALLSAPDPRPIPRQRYAGKIDSRPQGGGAGPAKGQPRRYGVTNNFLFF
jgi:hypothetical protein